MIGGYQRKDVKEGVVVVEPGDERGDIFVANLISFSWPIVCTIITFLKTLHIRDCNIHTLFHRRCNLKISGLVAGAVGLLFISIFTIVCVLIFL